MPAPVDTKRTKMIHIYTPAGEPYRVEIERETRRAYDNGDTISVPGEDKRVNCALNDLAKRVVPGGPVVITTFADLRALIASCADLLAAEAEAAEAARIAALNPNLP